MVVVYSTDDNYAQHAGVSIKSLLEHNKDVVSVQIYVINNDISAVNKDKLQLLVNEYENAALEFIDFSVYKKELHLNMEWEISISSYARLFLTEMLPDDCKKVLYLDCDTIINDDLTSLWEMDITNYAIAGIQDTTTAVTKEKVGVNGKQRYINAGVLLINLEYWRNDDALDKFLAFIDSKNGTVTHHDQGVLNGLYGDRCLFLDVKYNMMTIHYIFSRQQALKFFNEEAEFYTEADLAAARRSPAIIHFTPSFTSRPWCKRSKHPLKYIYWNTLHMTPWKNAKPIDSNEKWYVKLINWKYRSLAKLGLL